MTDYVRGWQKIALVSTKNQLDIENHANPSHSIFVVFIFITFQFRYHSETKKYACCTITIRMFELIAHGLVSINTT